MAFVRALWWEIERWKYREDKIKNPALRRLLLLLRIDSPELIQRVPHHSVVESAVLHNLVFRLDRMEGMVVSAEALRRSPAMQLFQQEVVSKKIIAKNDFPPTCT